MGVVVGLASLTITACSSSGSEGSGGTAGSGPGSGGTAATTGTSSNTDTGSTTDTTGTTGTTGTMSTTTTPTSTSDDPYQACVDAINALRSANGLPALARWKEAEPCVDQQATHDSQNNTPHGAWKSQMFADCNGHAQNECWGYGPGKVAKCVADEWSESQFPGCAGCAACFDQCTTQCPNCDFFGQQTGKVCGHYVNLATKCHTKVACGFSPTGGWIALNFQ